MPFLFSNGDKPLLAGWPDTSDTEKKPQELASLNLWIQPSDKSFSFPP